VKGTFGTWWSSYKDYPFRAESEPRVGGLVHTKLLLRHGYRKEKMNGKIRQFLNTRPLARKALAPDLPFRIDR
jgi:hypothetical protein